MRHRRYGHGRLGLPLVREQRGVVALEYLLLIGVVVTAMAAAIIIGVKQIVPQVAGLACSGADTADLVVEAGELVVVAPPAAGDCIVVAPAP